jgi:hypothetical protein
MDTTEYKAETASYAATVGSTAIVKAKSNDNYDYGYDMEED